MSCYDRIWHSDKVVSAALRERLIAEVTKLENVPEKEKHWRPDSNGQVLDLVHPSLYPVIYDRTLAYPEDSAADTRTADQLKPYKKPSFGCAWPNVYCISKRFQWLPTDFIVSDDGKSVKSDGYINNIHPIEHAELHKTIQETVAAFVPLFENVLRDSVVDNLKQSVPARTNNTYSYDLTGYPPQPPTGGDSDEDLDEDEYHSHHEYTAEYKEWRDNRPIVLPKVVQGGYKPGSLEQRKVEYSLAGKRIQIIIKLENIHLVSCDFR